MLHIFDIVGRCVRNAFVNHSSKKKKRTIFKKKKTEIYIYICVNPRYQISDNNWV